MLEGQAIGSTDCSRKGSMFDFSVEVLVAPVTNWLTPLTGAFHADADAQWLADPGPIRVGPWDI